MQVLQVPLRHELAACKPVSSAACSKNLTTGMDVTGPRLCPTSPSTKADNVSACCALSEATQGCPTFVYVDRGAGSQGDCYLLSGFDGLTGSDAQHTIGHDGAFPPPPPGNCLIANPVNFVPTQGYYTRQNAFLSLGNCETAGGQQANWTLTARGELQTAAGQCLRTYLRTYLRSSLRSRLHYCRSSDADRSRSCAQPLHRRRAPSRRLHRHR